MNQSTQTYGKISKRIKNFKPKENAKIEYTGRGVDHDLYRRKLFAKDWILKIQLGLPESGQNVKI